MPIPTQTEMFSVVLDIMADGKEHTRNELKGLTLEKLRLTEQEAAARTSTAPESAGRSRTCPGRSSSLASAEVST